MLFTTLSHTLYDLYIQYKLARPQISIKARGRLPRRRPRILAFVGVSGTITMSGHFSSYRELGGPFLNAFGSLRLLSWTLTRISPLVVCQSTL